MYKITAALALALGAEAGPHWGSCPEEVKPMATINWQRYSGQWYEIMRDYAIVFELFSGCVMGNYQPRDDG